MKAILLSLILLSFPAVSSGQQKATAGQQRYSYDVKLLASELEAAVKLHASGTDAETIKEEDNQLIQLSGLIMETELTFVTGDAPKRSVDEADQMQPVRSAIELHDKLARLYAAKHCKLSGVCSSDQ